MIYLGADHNGWKLKEEIKKYLESRRLAYQDMGNVRLDPDDDFPDFAFAVAKKVSGTKNTGILLCGSAVGMVIAANKVRGVRAAHVPDAFTAKQAREDDDANIMVLSGWFTKPATAKRLIRIWLSAKFSQKKRYHRRRDKIANFEKNKK